MSLHDKDEQILKMQQQLATIKEAMIELSALNPANSEIRAQHNRIVDALEGENINAGTRYVDSLKHTSLHTFRFEGKSLSRSAEREKALATEWAKMNEPSCGTPVLATLLAEDSNEPLWRMKMASPYTQPAATAAATTLQWLGSPVGFSFLCNALNLAGYAIVDERK